MSTRLKLTDSVVLNADEIIKINQSGNTVLVFTTITGSVVGERQSFFQIQAGTGKGANLAAAMNAALLGAPSGRVIKVPAGDYTVGTIQYVSEL
jgi:hypothetical protein